MANRGLWGDIEDGIMSPLFLAGAGLLAGEGFGGAMQGMQAGQRNQALRRQQMLQDQRQRAFAGLNLAGYDPRVAELARALPPESAATVLANAIPKPKDPLDEQYKRAQIAHMQAQTATAAGGGGYGKAGTIVQDQQGRFFSVQYGARGEPKVTPLEIGGQALQPAKGVDVVGDTVRDKATGRVVENIGQNLAGAERAKEIGTAQGKQAAAAPGDIRSADAALELIESIRKDPARGQGTGFSSVFNRVPGTKGFDFQRKVDQATSGAFLSAIQQLRGMGALSNAEGQTATAAITRMSTAQTEEGFIEALNDYEKIVTKGKAWAAQSIGGGYAPQTPQMAPETGSNWSIKRLD